MTKVLKINIITEVNGEKVEDKELIVPLGKDFLLKKVEDSLEGRKPGDEYSITLNPNDAYGNRRPELIKLIPMKFFKNDNLNPYPGLVIDVDGLLGRVRSVSPGRVLVDFNHPQAGKTLNYKIKVITEMTDKAQIAQEIIMHYTGLECKPKLVDEKVHVVIDAELPVEAVNQLSNELSGILDSKVEILTKKA